MVILALCILAQPISAGARTLSYTSRPIIWYQSWLEYMEDPGPLVPERGIIWTGKHFVGIERHEPGNQPQVFYYSLDRENWIEITQEQYFLAALSTWWGNKYLYRSRFHGFDIGISNARLFPEWMSFSSRQPSVFGMSGRVAVLDENFNVIAEYNADFYIIDFAYRNGRYYIKDLFNVVRVSTDFENWTIDNYEGRIPLFNTTGNLVESGVRRLEEPEPNGVHSRANHARIERNEQRINIVHETPRHLIRFQSAGDFYYYGIGNKLMVSRDGIYWADLELPDSIFPTGEMAAMRTDKTISIIEDSFFIRTRFLIYEFPLSEIFKALDEISAPFIIFNDNILGFDTPPVFEDGRLLVPMRFLFEQMGADVEWNQLTRGIHVESGNDIIDISIDNNIAMVNDVAIEMDVPARIVDNRAMIPLRFVSENLGFDIEWNEEMQTAVITTR